MDREYIEQLQDKMYSLVEQWRKSGERQSLFCKRHDIRVYQFCYWKRKYSVQEMSKAGFGLLQVQPESYSNQVDQKIEIRYPNGTSIYLSSGTSLGLIRNLIGL